MKNYDRYSVGYFPPATPHNEWVKKDHVEKAPTWCSVDLRDGNQALIVPMSLEEKVEFFQYLVKLGFKEIEVGFPAASETEYHFLRKLVDDNLIPDDVTIQVLTQSRKHIIKKTFDSLAGVKKAVVHLYNSTSLAQREQVFGDRFLFRIFSRKLHGNRSGFCSRDLQCRDRYLGTDSGKQGDHQSAIHSGNVHATRIRIADRIHVRTAPQQRKRYRVTAST